MVHFLETFYNMFTSFLHMSFKLFTYVLQTYNEHILQTSHVLENVLHTSNELLQSFTNVLQTYFILFMYV